MRKPRLILAGLLVSLAPTALLAQTSLPPGRVYVARDGGTTSIVIYGRISPETEGAFMAAAAAHRGARVVLNSGGGSLTPALSIGRAIREARLQTYVPDGSGCFSACSLIWLAGTERHIGQGARIGFHAAYVAQQGGPGQVSSSGNAVIGAYLSRLGYNDGAIRLFTAAPPNQIVVVKPRQFEQNGVTVRQTAARLPPPPADGPATAGAPGGFAGVWVGQYQCGKEVITARMSVREEGPSRLMAKFDFGPSQGAPAIPRGSYRMRGSRLANGAVELTPDGAPALPPGGRAVSMTGTVSGDTFAGQITGEACSPVTLRRLR
ncbi:hypothetical protein EJV46_06040 [Roseococcus sp. SYP-B2431]|uniref:COG3904 family protein n=1 Tax=Roseococcus sp. SYP-B2431 TaxID=2496640 RepID=UPI00103F7FAD|nr:hypothetical protein [Roseococcus sp. SYP-B2431]TCI00205.1 hypothetical protein EJV46_06040 [Roseococcus sp. SYP-B2431]